MKFYGSFILVHIYIQLVRTQDYHVLNYGAVGDGKQDDTVAVRSTFSAAANGNGDRVIFDSGHTFLTGGFNVSSNIIIDIRGTILGSTNTTLYQWNSAYWHPLILASHVQNVTMTGGGLIDGNGSIWWKCARTNNSLPPCENKSRPNLFYVGNGKNITIMNVTFKNSPGSGITFETIENGYIGNISILAPSSGDQNDPSINTDAIDIWRSVNVLVENSYISVGDVAFALESGGHIPNQNITIRNMTIGNSHGLALGSFQKAGNQNILFENIIINGSDKLDTGPNIISAPGRGGLTQNITYRNIHMYNMGYCISLSMNYGNPVYNITNPPPPDYTPQYKNINIYNVTCENSTNGWTIEGLADSEIYANFHNIIFKNVEKPFAVCKNIYGSCDNSTVLPYCPPCMSSAICQDASDDCYNYVGLCNNPVYRKQGDCLTGYSRNFRYHVVQQMSKNL